MEEEILVSEKRKKPSVFVMSCMTGCYARRGCLSHPSGSAEEPFLHYRKAFSALWKVLFEGAERAFPCREKHFPAV